MKLSRFVACLAVWVGTSAAHADISGPYEPQLWNISGIQGGTTSVTPESGVTETLTFGYDVDLGNPGNGVTFRTASYAINADRSGIMSFDWEYTGYHAWSGAHAYLEIVVSTSGGDVSTILVDQQNVGGGFAFSGSVEIEVEAGMPITIIAGGENSDYISYLQGEVTLTNFVRPLSLAGSYAMENWTSTGIDEGTTAITPESGDAVVGSFSYDVDLGGSGQGVSFRTSTFSAPAAATGTLSFEYDYTGHHSFYLAQVYLEVFAETSNGTNRVILVNESKSGGFSYAGSVSIDVEAGMPFGIIVGGSNFDANDFLYGQVDIRKFSGPVPFDSEYRLEHWSNTGIAGGTTATNPISGPADRAEFQYDVNLGNPGNGVEFRTTTWSVPSNHTGLVSFDWDYTGFHSYFDAYAYLEVFSETSSGTNRVTLVDVFDAGGFVYEGVAEIPVEAGMPFGIVVGGSNYDSNSVINGTVGLERLIFGYCPADFDQDGTVNTLDVISFLNAWSAGDMRADFDGDGTVNTLDMLAFLNAWSNGC